MEEDELLVDAYPEQGGGADKAASYRFSPWLLTIRVIIGFCIR
jgi:hypothetical protein